MRSLWRPYKEFGQSLFAASVADGLPEFVLTDVLTPRGDEV
jgi:hypothetical protein